jgi:hypothetical protein
MVRARSFLAATTLGLSVATAVGGAPHKADDPAKAEERSAQQLMDNCEAHKFETIVDAVVDGEARKSKVRLCGKVGQSDADWVGTLKDAIAKLHANKDMPTPLREQIVAAITAEISRLEIEGQVRRTEAAPVPRAPVPVRSELADEYSSLPQLPASPPPPPKVLGPVPTLSASGSGVRTKETSRELRPPLLLSGGVAPKLALTCYSPDDIAGDAPCAAFDRQTSLTIRAGENIPPGLSLLFLRNGERRATIELAQLNRGKSLRLPLPREVCQGVGDGSLELQIVQNGNLLKSDGPFSLRC